MDRRNLLVALAMTGTAITGTAITGVARRASAQPKPPNQAGARPAEKASPRRIAELFAATLSAHSIEAFATLFADTYRNHQTSAASPPAPGNRTDKQGTLAFFQARLAAIPDLHVAIEAIVAEEDMVAASFVYTGTQQHSLMGIPPTGRRLRFTSCDIFAVRGGQIVEHWGMGDLAGILAQLKG